MPRGNQQRQAARSGGREPALRVAFGAGAAPNTNIAIPEIKPNDVLISVLELQPPTAAAGNAIAGDRTADTSITSAGNVRSTDDTTGNQVLVIFLST